MLEKIMAKAFAAPLLRKAQDAATTYLPKLQGYVEKFPLNEDEQEIIALVRLIDGKPFLQLRILKKDLSLGDIAFEQDIYEFIMKITPEDINSFQAQAETIGNVLSDKI